MFGDVRLNVKTTGFDSSRKYIGEEVDESTGLNYLNARYYNSKQGRFISQDPMFWSFDVNYLVDPQQWNSYSYARNNPITMKDPSGKTTMDVINGAGIAFGQSITNLTVGLLQTIFHPIDTIKSIPQIPESVSNELKNSGEMIKNGNDFERGYAIMSSAFLIGSLIAPEGRVGKTGEVVPIFRGGKDFDITNRKGLDFKIDPKTGFVTDQKGPSINLDPNNKNVVEKGGAYQIINLPNQLRIKMGQDGHGQIVPQKNTQLTEGTFKKLLNQIKTKKYNGTNRSE